MTATYLDSGTRALPRPRAVVLAGRRFDIRHRLPRYSGPTASGGLRVPVPVPVPVGRPTADRGFVLRRDGRDGRPW